MPSPFNAAPQVPNVFVPCCPLSSMSWVKQLKWPAFGQPATPLSSSPRCRFAPTHTRFNKMSLSADASLWSLSLWRM